MRTKEIDKNYIYEREKGICYHCGKPVRRHKMTLDHYYPKSLGGSIDLFNLVCSCKQCNRLKRSSVPRDHELVNIALFKQAIKDNRLNVSELKMSNDEIIALTEGVNQLIRNRKNVIFEAPGVRFYVRDNRILKIIYFSVDEIALDYI